MFCKNCGFEIAEGSNFCQKCGCAVNENVASVNDELAKPAKKDEIKRTAKIAFIFSLLANLLPIGLGLNQFVQYEASWVIVGYGVFSLVLATVFSIIAIVRMVTKHKKDCVKENAFKKLVIAIAIPIALTIIVILIGSLRANAVSYDRAMKA